MLEGRPTQNNQSTLIDMNTKALNYTSAWDGSELSTVHRLEWALCYTKQKNKLFFSKHNSPKMSGRPGHPSNLEYKTLDFVREREVTDYAPFEQL